MLVLKRQQHRVLCFTLLILLSDHLAYFQLLLQVALWRSLANVFFITATSIARSILLLGILGPSSS